MKCAIAKAVKDKAAPIIIPLRKDFLWPLVICCSTVVRESPKASLRSLTNRGIFFSNQFLFFKGLGVWVNHYYG